MSDIDTQAAATEAPVLTDTVDEQVSTASTQSNDAPDATQGTEAQETSQTEVEAADTAGDKLYAGKYKTVEELEKSYASLQSKFGQTTNEKAELSRILNEAFSTPDTATQTATDDGFGDEPNPVNQEIDSLKRVTAVQSFILSHPEADPTAMQKVLAEDPMMKQISGHDAKLEYAFLRSQNMTQSKAIAEAEKRGAQATQAKIAEKTAAQVEAVKASQPTDETSELRERATGNYSQEVRDQARRELIRKQLVNL